MTGDQKFSSQVEKISCPQCGGTPTLKAKGYTQTLICPYCETILDLSQGDPIIQSIQAAKHRVKPLIPLGSKGKLHGALWEVIGFMQRMGVFKSTSSFSSPSSDEQSLFPLPKLSNYPNVQTNSHQPTIVWREYLLFNPYKGFRWLTEQNGHWNYVVTLHDIPEQSSQDKLSYLDLKYRFYESYQATVTYVLGEFYWRIQAGDKTAITDYLSINEEIHNYTTKKEILTLEQPVVSPISKDAEQTWSLAEYIEPTDIQTAFGLAQPLPNKIGIALNQPVRQEGILREVLLNSLLSSGILLLVAIIFASMMSPTVLSNDIISTPSFSPSTELPIFFPEKNSINYVSAPFHITDKMGVLKFSIQTPVYQQWVEIDGSLINNQTGEYFDIEGGVEYYSGYSDGEYWQEGNKMQSQIFSRPPQGVYHLALTITTNSRQPLPVQITLTEGYFSVVNFIFFFILMVLPGIAILCYIILFEYRRDK